MMIGIKFIKDFLLILLVSAFLTSCENNLLEVDNNSESEPEPEEFFYSNSFETPEDTMGWYGYADYTFFPEACPGGGLQSLYVSGGCYAPHAVFTLSLLTENTDLMFRFWARSLDRSSSVGLFLLTGQRPKPGIIISISDTTWQQYGDTLFCMSEFALEIELISGGIFPASMLIDKIEIVKINDK